MRTLSSRLFNCSLAVLSLCFSAFICCAASLLGAALVPLLGFFCPSSVFISYLSVLILLSLLSILSCSFLSAHSHSSFQVLPVCYSPSLLFSTYDRLCRSSLCFLSAVILLCVLFSLILRAVLALVLFGAVLPQCPFLVLFSFLFGPCFVRCAGLLVLPVCLSSPLGSLLAVLFVFLSVLFLVRCFRLFGLRFVLPLCCRRLCVLMLFRSSWSCVCCFRLCGLPFALGASRLSSAFSSLRWPRCSRQNSSR